ncbi:hypothetical protein DAI22_10g089500 [Oryza sativa Japonica Group]|nr:hypothetical protein DAI22_10g089500 [Oryza sativa Japonica Group]
MGARRRECTAASTSCHGRVVSPPAHTPRTAPPTPFPTLFPERKKGEEVFPAPSQREKGEEVEEKRGRDTGGRRAVLGVIDLVGHVAPRSSPRWPSLSSTSVPGRR